MDYEFRFYQGQELGALHMTSLASDSDACERARTYLCASPEFSHVEVRRSFHFMQVIANDFLPGESPQDWRSAP